MKQSIKNVYLVAFKAVVFATSLCAGSMTDAIETKLQQTWSQATLYQNSEATFLRKLAFTGRIQYDYSYYDNQQTSYHQENQWRRTRVGVKADFVNDFRLHAEADLDLNDHAPVYQGLTDAYLAWQPREDFKLKIGKQSAGFTLDGATSSKKLYRTERSLIAGNIWFGQEYFPGVTGSGHSGAWQWQAGLFSSADSQAFDHSFDASYFTLLSLGYDFAQYFEVDTALLRFDAVYQEEASTEAYAKGYVGTREHEHSLSLSWQYDQGRKHLHADLAYAKSFDGSHLYALQLMPFYDLNDTFQLVTSYTYIESSDTASLRLNRYAEPLAAENVQRASELYLGLNCYLHGHKVKWQNGIEYTNTHSEAYDGIGFTTALRISW